MTNVEKSELLHNLYKTDRDIQDYDSEARITCDLIINYIEKQDEKIAKMQKDIQILQQSKRYG